MYRREEGRGGKSRVEVLMTNRAAAPVSDSRRRHVVTAMRLRRAVQVSIVCRWQSVADNNRRQRQRARCIDERTN